jgi:predicted nucleic acid-binding protein
MNFNAIPAGVSVFLDANVLVYALAPDPVYGPPTKTFLKRIEQGDVEGYISTHVFSEIAHRLMTLEACQTFGWSYAGIARQLRRHPAEVQKLKDFRKALDDIMAISIHILPIHAQDVLAAGDLSVQHGLLSGDALVLATMQTNGLTHLASNDADFDRVPGIIRSGPV